MLEEIKLKMIEEAQLAFENDKKKKKGKKDAIETEFDPSSIIPRLPD